MANKTRRSKADLELLKELEDLDRRMRETDREVGAAFEKIRVAREKLRAILEPNRRHSELIASLRAPARRDV